MPRRPSPVTPLHIQRARHQLRIVYAIAQLDGLPVGFRELGPVSAVGRSDRSRQRYAEIQLEPVALRGRRRVQHRFYASAQMTDRFNIGGAGGRLTARSQPIGDRPLG